MLLERTNLQRKLEALQRREKFPYDPLEEVQRILTEGDTEKNILQRISEGYQDEPVTNKFDFDLLETSRIFHLSQIRKLCISYRLRFISSKFFKGTLPEETISTIQELEELHKIKLSACSIVAPASYFQLENADDPLLFAHIGNDYFYLVHKWGTDMHPLRKLFMWPLRNFENLVLFCLFISFFLSFGIRNIFFHGFQELSHFLVIFMYTFKAVIALVIFYGISLGKNFSSSNWNSKFYNA